jgi:hypothetical protein
MIDAMPFRTLTPTTLWYSKDSEPWDALLKAYWQQPTVRRTLRIHKELEHLDRDKVLGQDDEGWYRWLRDEFVPWKFAGLYPKKRQEGIDKQWATESGKSVISHVRRDMQAVMDSGGFTEALSLVREIDGIGMSAGSAIVALLFPELCATADSRVVRFLRQIFDLPEQPKLRSIRDPKNLRSCDAVTIVQIVQRKSVELNKKFDLQCWTPRLVERCLWTFDSECGEG